MSIEINRKELPVGSVAYYVKSNGFVKQVAYGLVEEHYTHEICLKLLEPVDKTTIDGIPKKQFETPTPWKKLPKGWSYDTRLFHIDCSENPKEYNESSPEDVLTAYSKGLLVDVEWNDHSIIESEVDKNLGYRIVKKHVSSNEPRKYVSLNYHSVYATHAEAQQVVDDYEAELKRQSELSDYDWSVEKLDETLSHFKLLYGVSDDTIQKYRSWLLERDNVEDLEVRIHNGDIQWKMFKRKRWMNIEE